MNKFSKIIFLTFLFLLFTKTDFIFGVCDQRFGAYAEQAAKEVLGCEEVKIGNQVIKTKDIILAEIAHESCCGNPTCGSFRRPIYYYGKGRDYIMNLCKQLGRDSTSLDLNKTCVVTYDGGMGWAQYMPDTWKELIVKGGYPYGVKDPWNDRDAAYLVAIHLKKRAGPGGFCENPVASIKKYNGDGLAYVYKVLEKIGQKIKEVIGEIITAIEKVWKEYARLELEYPEIFGLKPKEVTIGLEFFKYIYLFVIWSLGFLLFIVLLYYGILWYTAGANIEQALRAKQRIIQAFFGAILLLGSWILLEILSPQFTKIQKEIPSPQEVKTLPEVEKKEGEKVVVAKRIVLDHLVNKSVLSPSATTTPTKASFDEILKYRTFGVNSALGEIQFGLGEEQGFAMDNVPNSDASYNWEQALVSDEEREQIKRDAENFAKITTDENARRQYKTTIREVRSVVNAIYEEYCKACFEGCPLILNFTCDSSCKTECEKLKNLKNKAENFPVNAEYLPTTRDLEEKREGVNKVEEEKIPPGNYSHYKDEDYYERGKKAVDEILSLSRAINCSQIENCPTCSSSTSIFNKKTYAVIDSEEEFNCEKMKSTIEDFAKGWEIRKAGWQVITEAQSIAQKQSQYLNLLRENLKSGTDYLYEGTVAPSRIERILGTNKVLRIKSDFAKNLALTTEALSAAITTLLVGGCHCPECVGCGACAGDACLIVRPLLSALQVALGVNIVAMPLVAQQVQKEVDKEIREKDELKKSLEELTEGLALAEKEIFTCEGVTKNGEFKQLFSALEFLKYKNEVEKRGYKVIIQDLWPNIKPEGDAFVFYCVTGPLVEGVSDIYNPNNLKNLKLYCDQSTESEIGELFDKIKYVIKGKEQILDQKDKEIKNAQKLVDELRRNQKGLEQGLDALENSKGELSEDSLNQIGEKLKNISGQQFAEMIGKLPEKYAKEAIGNIIENVENEVIKGFFVQALTGIKENGVLKFKGIDDKDFKEIFGNYLSSMMDEKLKKFSHSLLENLSTPKVRINAVRSPISPLKKNLITGFLIISADPKNPEKIREFWKNVFKNFNEKEKALFFSNYFKKINDEGLMGSGEKICDDIVCQLFSYIPSEVEKKQAIKEMVEVLDSASINEIFKECIQKTQRNRTILPQQINLKTIIAEECSSKDVISFLKRKNLVRVAALNVSPEIWTSAFLNMPSGGGGGDFIGKFFHYLPTSELNDFVLGTILDIDPTFFQKFFNELPTKLDEKYVESIRNSFNPNLPAELHGTLEETDPLAYEFLKASFFNDFCITSRPRGILPQTVIGQMIKEREEKCAKEKGEELSERRRVMKVFIGENTFSLLDSPKDVFSLLHQFPDRDPRRVLNHLFLKYLPLNRNPNEDKARLSRAMDILKAGGIFDQFLGEAAAVCNFNPEWNSWGEIVKDIGDKINSFTFELKKVTNDILDGIPLYPGDPKMDVWKLALFTQDAFIQTPNLSVRNILSEVYKNIPSKLLFDSTKEFLKSISSEELKKISKEIFNQLSATELKETSQSIVDELPKEQTLTALTELSKTISLEDIKNSLDRLPSESKIEIFKNFIYPYYLSEEERKQWIGKTPTEEEWKSFLNRVQTKEIIYSALSYLPETDLKNILKDFVRKTSKENLTAILPKLPSVASNTNNVYKFLDKLSSDSLQKIILNAFPENELKNFSDSLFKNIAIQLPIDDARKLLRNALNKDLELFKNSVNNLFPQLLNKLPKETSNKLTNQLLSALPTNERVETFNQIISQLPSEFSNTILAQLQQLLGPLFSLFTGGPGLKQNALVMMSYPTQYLTACPRCCHAPCKKPIPACAGIPGPLAMCSPKPVLQRMDLITINIRKIALFKELVDKALNIEENIIEKKIKEDIWPTVTHNTYIFSSRQCITIEPGKEGYLVKCEDALRYGWVGKCDHKYNFVCCKRK
jgi:histone H3/H4